MKGDIPKPDVGRQASSLILDIDKDGVNDFVIAGWSDQTSMVWFKHTPKGLPGTSAGGHLVKQRYV